MTKTLERPLSSEERLKKAKVLLDRGVEGFDAARQAEDELRIRERASVSCETAFHALVELANAVLARAGKPEPESHGARVEALEDIGRHDLAALYERSEAALHFECYYGQRVGRRQEERLRELADAVDRELKKLR